MRFLPIQLLLGLTFCTFLPFLASSLDVLNQFFFTGGYLNLVLSGCLVCATIITLHSIQRFPGITSSTYIIPVIFFWFLLILLLIKLSNTIYSFYYYSFSGFLLLIYLFSVGYNLLVLFFSGMSYTKNSQCLTKCMVFTYRTGVR